MLSRTALTHWRHRLLSAGHFGKVAMGLCTIAVGTMILTGVDRRVETTLVSASPAWLTDLTTQFLSRCRRLHSLCIMVRPF